MTSNPTGSANRQDHGLRPIGRFCVWLEDTRETERTFVVLPTEHLCLLLGTCPGDGHNCAIHDQDRESADRAAARLNRALVEESA